MERFWQWVWDRHAANYSCAMYIAAIAVSLPFYILLSSLIVAVEGSGKYVEAAAVAVIAVPLLAYANMLPGLGWSRLVDRWAGGGVDAARALDATYAWARNASARILWCNSICVALLSVIVGGIVGVTGSRLVQYGIMGAAVGAASGLSGMHSLGEAAIRPARAAIAGSAGIGDALPRSRPTFAAWSNVFVLASMFNFTVNAAMLAAAFAHVRMAEHFDGALRIGIGINTGVVIAGTIGGGGKLEFTLIGDTVNVAARVEQLTKITSDTVLLTQQTVEALASRPPGLADRGSHALKGKSAEVQVFGLDPRGVVC